MDGNAPPSSSSTSSSPPWSPHFHATKSTIPEYPKRCRIVHERSALSLISARRFFAHRFRDPKASCIRIPDLMADELSKNQPLESMENSNKKGEQQPEKSPPPPLPEKPLPGDCCGSGCVRCVWDVYYEELEAYDEYYRNESKPKS